MRLIGPVKTSVYIYLTPVVTIVFAKIILNDAIHPLALAGAALTLLGLGISQRPALRLYGQSRAEARK